MGNLTLGLTSLVKNEDRANSLELQLGTTGTNSLAKGSQHFIHKLWGMEQWPGWANQLPGEMTANLFFKRYYRLRGLEKRYGSGFETDPGLLACGRRHSKGAGGGRHVLPLRL